VTGLVPAHRPYDAGRMLWFLGRHATPGVEAYADTGHGVAYSRVLRLSGGPGIAQLTLAGDPGPALAHLSAGPLLDVAARPGLRVPGSVDPVETLVSSVVGQQISLAGARTVTGRVVSDHGEPLPAAMARDGLTHAFPTAAALAALDPASLPMPRSRGRSIVAIAAAVVRGGEHLVAGTRDVESELLSLPGVGPWTAAYQALRAARDPDAFMPTDLAVRRVLQASGLPGDPRAARERSARWAPYRSLALMHLWFAYLERRPDALSVPGGTLGG
jgi:AraC family transcriptional regulator, regulatory protein of adaptative response / DNA-3-methyladenine glycosylase II